MPLNEVFFVIFTKKIRQGVKPHVVLRTLIEILSEAEDLALKKKQLTASKLGEGFQTQDGKLYSRSGESIDELLEWSVAVLGGDGKTYEAIKAVPGNFKYFYERANGLGVKKRAIQLIYEINPIQGVRSG